ncbi:Sulfide dehydrogenase [flavocytochrome c] flavoprotein chain [archaeon HR06]|nr:Sulfide dehydrogenase [flavocytochrome c] flavoprotein chain [archaeon HR06]
MKRILILGGGFGGLTAANELRRALTPDNEIILIDKSKKFSMGLGNLWIIIGERDKPEERNLSELNKKGIKFLNEEILKIKPKDKEVITSSSTLKGDYIIVALGAELAPNLIPGFSSSAYNFYEPYECINLQRALKNFNEGKIVILISRVPFKCPPAPYEAAFLIDDFLRKRKIRGKIKIELYTPEFQPMPVAGPDVGKKIVNMLKEREIDYFPEHTVLRIEPELKKIIFETNETNFDLLIGVPPHIPPKVIRESDLVDSLGWIPVNPETLETKYKGIFAIGDNTLIKLKNGMPLPKAGIFAEEEAKVVSKNIINEIKGERSYHTFKGEGFCYIEIGEGKALLGKGEFYSSPSPKITLDGPSTLYKEEKKEFEKVRLDSWF